MTDSNDTSNQINLTDSGLSCSAGCHQQQGRCPRCGYCPCCGRGGFVPQPWPQPYYVGDPPYWYYQTWCGTGTQHGNIY